jgi:arylsulfatase
MIPHIEEWGGPDTFPHFAVGWAHAGNTPFQWTKQVASHFGGTRNGMIVHWPARVATKGEIRSQFTHVTDIAPTVLEAAGLPFPTHVDGIEQKPFNGVSMVYSFDDPKAAERHTTQYFEMFGNRGIYHDGWVAATRHSIPWDLAHKLPSLSEDRWELYNVNEDFSQSEDLAATYPEKLQELQEIFEEEAIKNFVYPIDDRRSERFIAAVAGRPDLIGSRTSLTVYTGMTLMENAFLDIKNHSHAITAELDLPKAINGVIIAQAGKFGGWALYAKNGKIHYDYNYFGLEHTNISSPAALTAGKHTVRYEFIADAKKPGTGGMGSLYINGEKVAERRIPRTQPFSYSADEGVDVGIDRETVVSKNYAQGNNQFTGKIAKVVVEQLPM